MYSYGTSLAIRSDIRLTLSLKNVYHQDTNWITQNTLQNLVLGTVLFGLLPILFMFTSGSFYTG